MRVFRALGTLVTAGSVVVLTAASLRAATVPSTASSTAPPTFAADRPLDEAPPQLPRPSPAAGGDTEADGVLPAGVTVFDRRHPGVVRLDASLLGALRAAAVDAATDGIELQVNSGWRSAEYQRRLLDEAVVTYGSVEAASRWVAPVTRSAHVRGDAADIGPADAAPWLARRGARYDLCVVYANEPWHVELRPGAATGGCPEPYADASVDPRLHP